MPFYLAHMQNTISNLIKKFYKQISLPNVENSRKKFPSPMGNQNVPVKRVAFRASRKGSFTIEAAWALPLFLLSVTALTGLMEIYGTYARTVVSLQEEVEKLGMFAAVAEEPEDLIIERTGQAEYKPFWLPFQATTVRAVCRGRVRAWTGQTISDDDGTWTGGGETLVYVTEYGGVYHTTSRCSYLSLSIRQVAASAVTGLRNDSGGKYYPCEKCVGSGEIHSYLYIAGQGDRYHNSLECSGLKRTVQLQPLSSLAGMECCSRCSQLEGGT